MYKTVTVTLPRILKSLLTYPIDQIKKYHVSTFLFQKCHNDLNRKYVQKFGFFLSPSAYPFLTAVKEHIIFAGVTYMFEIQNSDRKH